MENNVKLIYYYKNIKKKTYKNYYLIVNGVLIPVNIYIVPENKDFYKYCLRDIPCYTYESIKDFMSKKIGLNDLVIDTYKDFCDRNGI